MLSDARQQEVIEFCQKLVSIPSTSGHEEAVAEALQAKMRGLGYHDVWSDGQGNVIGKIKGDGGRSLLFDGHLDTMPVTDREEWTYDPFGGQIVGGNLHGRGAVDMKGGIAAMVCGLGYLIQDAITLRGDIYVSGTVGEEIVEVGAIASVIERISPAFVVIAEGTNLGVAIAQRGRARIELETQGRIAHAAYPERGVNAITKMMRVIEAIEQLPVPQDPLLGNGVIVLTGIVSVPYPGLCSVPYGCLATFERRVLPGESEEDLLRQVEGAVNWAKALDPEVETRVHMGVESFRAYTGVTVSAKAFAPAWKTDVNSEIVQRALAGLRSVGLNSSVSKYMFATNGSYSAGIRRIPTIGFGPGSESVAHMKDEYVPVEQLVGAAAGYYGIAKEVLS